MSDVWQGVGGAVLGAMIGAAAAIVGGVAGAAGSAYAALPAYQQQAGSACLDYEDWVFRRVGAKNTDEEILAMTLHAVRGGTYREARTVPVLPTSGATPTPSVTTIETAFYQVCDAKTKEDISNLIRELRGYAEKK